MSEAPGEATTCRRLVLRVSVPTGDAYHTIAKELAAKAARAYVGDPEDPDGNGWPPAAFDGGGVAWSCRTAVRHDVGSSSSRRTDDELLDPTARCDGRVRRQPAAGLPS